MAVVVAAAVVVVAVAAVVVEAVQAVVVPEDALADVSFVALAVAAVD